MATVSGSALGSFKGKIGNAVSYEMYGKNVVRSLPRKSVKNKQGSVTQNVNRSKFTKMQDFLRPIIPFIRVGFNLEARARQVSAHNVAKSCNMRNAFDLDGAIDYSKIVVSYGTLPGVEGITLAKDDAGIHFSWQDNSDPHLLTSDDQVMLLAYSPAKKLAEMTLSGARRKAKQDTLAINYFENGQEIHVWMAFISDDRQQISMSTYVGTVTV